MIRSPKRLTLYLRVIERLRIWDGRGVGYHPPSCVEQCLTAPGKVSIFMATNSITLQLRGRWDILSGRFRQSVSYYCHDKRHISQIT